jgi:hypothetical protein
MVNVHRSQLLKMAFAFRGKWEELCDITEDEDGNEVQPESPPWGVDGLSFQELLAWLLEMEAWARELAGPAQPAGGPQQWAREADQRRQEADAMAEEGMIAGKIGPASAEGPSLPQPEGAGD